MKAAQLQTDRNVSMIKIIEMPKPRLHSTGVRIRLKAAALNYRDTLLTHQSDTNYHILGSDGAGIVESVGELVTDLFCGAEVIINPSLFWPHKSLEPPEQFRILGYPDQGTHAEFIVVDQSQVHLKPQHLNWEQAAALPLAGLTAYRALFTRAQLKKGEKVLIVGIGGGVATILLMMAKAVGATVIVTSRHPWKLEKALAIGADAAFLAKEAWDEEIMAWTEGRGIEVIIDSVGGSLWPELLKVIRPGGRLVNFGIAGGTQEATVPLVPLFWNQYSLLGTTMGSNEEFTLMLNYINQHQIAPIIDAAFSFEDIQQAYRQLESGNHFGKIVLRIDNN
jgi:zinc-binding alcohol dehydrogenase/oxidoreductase